MYLPRPGREKAKVKIDVNKGPRPSFSGLASSIFY